MLFQISSLWANQSVRYLLTFASVFQTNKLETLSLREETAEELAQVISPEPKHRNRTHTDPTATLKSVNDSPEHVTLLSVTHELASHQEQSKCWFQEKKLNKLFSVKPVCPTFVSKNPVSSYRFELKML